jgi:metal-responsive CopG/Arc/MetJ family transcriptional regulator
MAVRTTVHLDEELLARLRGRVSQRGLSRFINEAVSEKMASLERQEIEAAMIEGYLASREDHREIDEDWRGVEVDRWPE